LDIALSNYNNNISFIESTPNHNNIIKPLFFYHIPKTGGISFSNSLSISAHSAFNRIQVEVNPSFDVPVVDRVDEKTQIDASGTKSINFLCGHVKWGWHERCDSDFHFSTIIRSPIDRVLSDYNYHCMREQRKPNREEFIEFFRDENNINVSCKLLSPDSKSKLNGELIFEHLSNNFHSYIPVSLINELLSYYLSLYGFPNVITERVNTTLPQYKLDGREFTDELAILNKEDLVLFNLVKEFPRLPKLDLNDDSISDRTIVLKETEKELRSLINSTEISTNVFFDKMDEDIEKMANLDEIIKLDLNL